MLQLNSILSNALDNATQLAPLYSGLQEAQTLLTQWSNSSTLIQKQSELAAIFGENYDVESLVGILGDWQEGDFNLIPPVEVLSASQLYHVR